VCMFVSNCVCSRNLKKRGARISILALAPQKFLFRNTGKKMEDTGLNVGVHFLRLFSSCAHFLPHKSLSILTAFFDEQLEVCRKS